MKRRHKPAIGDIFAVRTSKGLAYIQFSHIPPDDEIPLIRVLPGFFDAPPDGLRELIEGPELYYASYTLEHALKTGAVEFVRNEPVPLDARKFPVMRQRGGVGWFIGEASIPLTIEGYRRLRHVIELSPAEKRLSIRKICSPEALLFDLERGWTPEKDDALNAQASADKRGMGLQLSSKREFLDHYFYFSERRDASGAASDLRKRGWFAEPRKSPADDAWLVVAKQPSEQLQLVESEDLRTELEELATKFHGKYDGWGMAI